VQFRQVHLRLGEVLPRCSLEVLVRLLLVDVDQNAIAVDDAEAVERLAIALVRQQKDGEIIMKRSARERESESWRKGSTGDYDF
jgi:hypothetical protein